MQRHSARQLEILSKMGIDVWSLRQSVNESESIEPVSNEARSNELSTNQPPPDMDEALESHQAIESDYQINESETQNNQAGSCSSLEQLDQVVKACTRCPLHQSRTQTVFGVGNPNADWMFVGEAPGQTEDEQGQPFVGRAGQLLDSMIAALGMSREQVFIANVLKCRPPNNRDPIPEEVDQCEHYLHQQLQLIQPKVIVSLGRISAQLLLRSTESLGALRKTVHAYGESSIPLVATYHPAYLLRSPKEKAKAWGDLWKAKLICNETNT